MNNFIASARVTLIAAIVLILIAPVLLSQSSFWPILDLSTSGQIGDTIGGVTAPIINLLGAWLVYVSFQQQVKANELQSKAHKEQLNFAIDQLNDSRLSRRFEYLSARLDRIEELLSVHAYSPEQGIEYFGTIAAHVYAGRLRRTAPQQYDKVWSDLQLRFYLEQHLRFVKAYTMIENRDLDKKDQELLFSSAKDLYREYFAEIADATLELHEKIGTHKRNMISIGIKFQIQILKEQREKFS